MTLAVFVKALTIAVCAGVLAAAYLLIPTVRGGLISEGPGLDFEEVGRTVMLSVGASFAIGLPVALLTFVLSWRHLMVSATTLAMVTTLAGIMMVLTSYAIMDQWGVLALGIPAFIAALTYGILGWFWILKPLRKASLP